MNASSGMGMVGAIVWMVVLFGIMYFLMLRPQKKEQKRLQAMLNDMEEQISSIENQTLYYTKKIAETENWNLQDIYSDEGKSGTSLRKRDAFKRMMRDAKDQKMDLIICASISRFARNFSDCMTQIAALKTMHPAHPIGV